VTPAARRSFPPTSARPCSLKLVALASAGPTGDRLLTVEEAAYKLACSADTLYRNKRHPARIQDGRSVRFSEKKLDATIVRRLRAQG
jgi:predicted DNA-binding transcriptional regulator AlpA